MARTQTTPTQTTTPGKYNSPLRARQAAQTRRDLLEAASRLFAERGWAATTLSDVAAQAGTAVETIYTSVGSKAALLYDAINVALVGDDEPVALVGRQGFQSLGSGSTSARIRAAAHLIAEIHDRSVPLLRALQEAAASDDVAAERWERYEAERRQTIAVGCRW